MCNCITVTDVTEIKETVYGSAKAMFTDADRISDYSTKRGKEILDNFNDSFKPLGVENMQELFDMILTELKTVMDIEVDLNDFLPQRVFVQPLVGETESCIVYTEANDIAIFASTQKLVSKFTTMLMVKEDGKWLVDSLVD